MTVTDAAGTATTLTIPDFVIDTTAPTVVSFVLADTALKAGETSLVTLTFSDDVVGFASADDIAVVNGTLSIMSSADGGVTWTGTYTPSVDITDTTNVLTLSVEYTDVAGNAGPSASTDNFTIDTALPTLSVVTVIATPSNTTEPTFVFSSDKVGTITSTLGFSTSTSAIVGNNIITFNTLGDATRTGKTVTVTDAAGNATTLTIPDFVIDTVQPEITITSSTIAGSGSITLDSTIDLIFTSTKSTNNLVVSDITVTNGNLTDFTRNGTIYTATLTPVDYGTCIISIPEASYTDSVGNANIASSEFTWIRNSPPVITIEGNIIDYILKHDTEPYNDMGATVLDAEDNNLTNSIRVGGDSVYRNIVGEYVIIYTVTDSHGLTVSANRWVKVVTELPTPTCFPADTPIQTDQGVTVIDKLVPGVHTLRGKRIIAITETRPLQKQIVCFEKDSIGKNVPSQQTLCSKEHKVLYRGEMIKARDLADMCKNVKKVSYNGETLYNVLLEKHGKMLVNNMICETLHPENIAAKFAKAKSSSKKNTTV